MWNNYWQHGHHQPPRRGHHFPQNTKWQWDPAAEKWIQITNDDNGGQTPTPPSHTGHGYNHPHTHESHGYNSDHYGNYGQAGMNFHYEEHLEVHNEFKKTFNELINKLRKAGADEETIDYFRTQFLNAPTPQRGQIVDLRDVRTAYAEILKEMNDELEALAPKIENTTQTDGESDIANLTKQISEQQKNINELAEKAAKNGQWDCYEKLDGLESELFSLPTVNADNYAETKAKFDEISAKIETIAKEINGTEENDSVSEEDKKLYELHLEVYNSFQRQFEALFKNLKAAGASDRTIKYFQTQIQNLPVPTLGQTVDINDISNAYSLIYKEMLNEMEALIGTPTPDSQKPTAEELQIYKTTISELKYKTQTLMDNYANADEYLALNNALARLNNLDETLENLSIKDIVSELNEISGVLNEVTARIEKTEQVQKATEVADFAQATITKLNEWIDRYDLTHDQDAVAKWKNMITTLEAFTDVEKLTSMELDYDLIKQEIEEIRQEALELQHERADYYRKRLNGFDSEDRTKYPNLYRHLRDNRYHDSF